MSDPATTEITGPTIVESGQPGSRLLRTARRIAGTSSTSRSSCGRRTSTNSALRAILSDWQFSPIVRWQIGQPLERDDRRRQRADRPRRPAGGADSRRSVRRPAAPTAYLNRAAFTSPATGTYSTLAPFTIVNPGNLQNDFALTRTFKIARRADRAVPVGSVQRDQPRELQRAGHGAQQRELRPDPDAPAIRVSCSSR